MYLDFRINWQYYLNWIHISLRRIRIFISSNDQYVPADLSISLAEKLEFPYEIIPNAGHFLASDGYREFPQLLDWLQMVIGGVEEVGDSNDSAQNQSR